MNRDNHDPCTLATTCNICPKTKHQYCLCQISYSRSLAACECFVDSCLSFCTFSFGHYVVCSFCPFVPFLLAIMLYVLF